MNNFFLTEVIDNWRILCYFLLSTVGMSVTTYDSMLTATLEFWGYTYIWDGGSFLTLAMSMK